MKKRLMKATYMQPETQMVHVRLLGSVLGAVGVVGGSNRAGDMWAKEVDFDDWDDDSGSGSLWDDEYEEEN